MIVEFWGVRGSVPVSGKGYLKYGGNTPCLSIVSRTGDILIVDAGTGIRSLSDELPAPAKGKKQTIHLLLTHFHMDHLMGLPLFAPLYSENTVANFLSPLPAHVIEKSLEGFTGDKYFPIPFKDTPATKHFLTVDPEGTKVGAFRITALAVNHPQGAFAYRIDDGVSSIVVATDIEPDGGKTDAEFIEFSRGADCLVWDSAFTPAEFRRRRGWGHATWLHGIKIAKAAGIRRLVLDHFSPEHNDHRIQVILKRARAMFPKTVAAREGLSLRLEGGKEDKPEKKAGKGRKSAKTSKPTKVGKTAKRVKGGRPGRPARSAKVGKAEKTGKARKRPV